MSKQFKVAVVGATGAVGETMLSILAEREFPASEVIALASERSAGMTVEFGNGDLVVQDLATFDPSGVDIALFSAGGATSKEYAPKFAAAGAVVIDNSSTFRYDDDVPLVVSEVNPEAGIRNRPRGIIANPNCSTMQLMVALKPIFTPPASSASTWRRTSRCRARAAPGWRSWACRPPQAAELPGDRTEEVPGADRLQPDPAHRRLPGQRLHQGRDEAGLGDPQDPGRRHHPGEPDRGARAGVLRAFRGGERRDARRSSAPTARANCWRLRRAWKWSTSARPAAIPRR
jgi:hypothetical protein